MVIRLLVLIFMLLFLVWIFLIKPIGVNRVRGFFYRSKILEELWTKGHSEIGTVSFKTAGYCARYIMKKVTGTMAAFHYCEIDEETGEVLRELHPEFSQMSRKPGIGRTWIEKYLSDVYPHDHVIVDGRERRVPRYYDKFFRDYCFSHKWQDCPGTHDEIIHERALDFMAHSADLTPQRLAVLETILDSKISRLVRPLD